MVTRSRQLPNSKSAGRTSATGYTSFHRSGLALGACLGMKSIGKPCAKCGQDKNVVPSPGALWIGALQWMDTT